ncbi:hypothetical protein [Clostridium tertium]|uniref:hypothetical protein n=1 Tax=Clostridium tertium TaxID=1559 RepID=UPI0023B2B401|nr:hypothetical protein [Clostridium tertium]
MPINLNTKPKSNPHQTMKKKSKKSNDIVEQDIPRKSSKSNSSVARKQSSIRNNSSLNMHKKDARQDERYGNQRRERARYENTEQDYENYNEENFNEPPTTKQNHKIAGRSKQKTQREKGGSSRPKNDSFKGYKPASNTVNMKGKKAQKAAHTSKRTTKYKESSIEDSAPSLDVAPIIIDVDGIPKSNYTNVTTDSLNEYISKKIIKKDIRNYMKINFHDDAINYSTLSEEPYHPIELDFHDRAFNLKNLALSDSDNSILNITQNQEKIVKNKPLDLMSYKEEVVEKAENDGFDDSKMSEFFDNPLGEQVEEVVSFDILNIPKVDSVSLEVPVEVKEESNNSLDFLDNLNNFILSSEDNTPTDNDTLLVFGEEANESYIEDTPLIVSSAYVPTNAAKAGVNTIESFLIEVKEEGEQ